MKVFAKYRNRFREIIYSPEANQVVRSIEEQKEIQEVIKLLQENIKSEMPAFYSDTNSYVTKAPKLDIPNSRGN
jgi:hypothetical protein